MTEKERIIISSRLKNLMESRGIGAKELASNIGVSVKTVEDWLNKKAYPTFVQLCFVDQFFGIKMGYWL